MMEYQDITYSKPRRLKPYKASNPFTTVNKIRKILEELDIFTTEEFFKHNERFFVYRIFINNPDLNSYLIGTNGKGMSPKYALASAYGEFMERIQTGMLLAINKEFIVDKFSYKSNLHKNAIEFFDKQNLTTDFYIAPDEISYDIEAAFDQLPELYKSLLGFERDKAISYLKKSYHGDKIELVPFYDVRNRQIINLPYKLLLKYTGSNGMAAGNTKKESLLQGICEIFERYVLKSIFEGNITPPTIPLELFEGTEIYKSIKIIEKENNFHVILKDCSLGKGFPVHGVLIADKKTNKFTFHLGADPSPITAIERCLTEIFQSKNYMNKFQNNEFFNPDYETPDLSREFYKSRRNSTGIWPKSILDDNFSYEFEGFSHPDSISDDDDFEYIVNLILKMGYNLYFREISFLGIPAFYVYIPGLSERETLVERQNSQYFFSAQKTLLMLDRAKDEELEILQKEIQTYAGNVGDFFLYKNDNIFRMNRNLLLCTICLKRKDLETALLYLDKIIEKIPDDLRPANKYYFCSRDYLFYKTKGISDPDIQAKLSNYYNDSLISEVIEDLKNPDSAFRYIDSPECFDCSSCGLRKKCRYIELLRIQKKLDEKYRLNCPDQKELKLLFE